MTLYLKVHIYNISNYFNIIIESFVTTHHVNVHNCKYLKLHETCLLELKQKLCET